jgi:hypothetical protein
MVAQNNAPNRPRRAARDWCLAGLLFALVCVQGLGFVHRILHAPGAAWAAGPAHAQAADDEARSDAFAGLFSAHDNDSGCRLYDGVGHQVFALPAALVVCALLPAQDRLRLLAGEFAARRAAFFEARGPPLSR